MDCHRLKTSPEESVPSSANLLVRQGLFRILEAHDYSILKLIAINSRMSLVCTADLRQLGDRSSTVPGSVRLALLLLEKRKRHWQGADGNEGRGWRSSHPKSLDLAGQENEVVAASFSRDIPT